MTKVSSLEPGSACSGRRSLTVVGPAAGIQVKHEVSNNQPKSPNTHDVRQRRIIMNRAHIHSLTSSTGGLGLG